VVKVTSAILKLCVRGGVVEPFVLKIMPSSYPDLPVLRERMMSKTYFRSPWKKEHVQFADFDRDSGFCERIQLWVMILKCLILRGVCHCGLAH
jgi:hypothetical protein